MKLNFVKAYATYCKYCKACNVRPNSVQSFAEDWADVCHPGSGANCDYTDPEVQATIARA